MWGVGSDVVGAGSISSPGIASNAHTHTHTRISPFVVVIVVAVLLLLFFSCLRVGNKRVLAQYEKCIIHK